jgi:hypothetical protein
MQAATASAAFAGVSAAVALGSALGALIAASRSRSDKKQTELRSDESLKAAQAAAVALGRIAQVQESLHASTESAQAAHESAEAERESSEAEHESAQAKRVGFVPSPVQRGRTGWRIKNDSDAPVYAVEVRTTNRAKVVVYRGSGPDQVDSDDEPLLTAHESSQMMFRPADSDAAAADPSELERMTVTFTDARGQRWERIGWRPPRKLDS